jgi:DNA (cytosine-5)-methyltransferase 1
MMVANCSGERSFSQLKRIKNEFRTTMTRDKLCSLSLMCIESNKLLSLSFEDVISDFVLAKARKKMFYFNIIPQSLQHVSRD